MLPKRRIKGHTTKDNLCIGCGVEVTPGFCYTGSIISGIKFSRIQGQQRMPITAVIETWERSYVVGGELINTHRTVGYYSRMKGYICTDCASNYHTVEDRQGNKHQIVMTDARPGFIGETVRGDNVLPLAASKSPRKSSILPPRFT